ncbi:hypothetical protein QBC34DRAFT_376319 [Podospora aff. communis PSN243]|uniref:Uncharacterized protein n=1 Tax=Podospora aff. communis PSN243 TaxID=3040156 RepID=A0AAV9H3B9_9PEZI|nr:hypothetical protein QBC34DRAFT_376319 [Podospora aff. communis PSN243]
MKSSLTRRLAASISLAAVALALVASPVSGSPIRQPHQVRDVVPLRSARPPETPSPVPLLETQEEEVRNRAKALNTTLAEERAEFEGRYRERRRMLRDQHQIMVDTITNGTRAWELDISERFRMGQLSTFLENEWEEMKTEYVKDKNTLLRAQWGRVSALEADWKRLTGGEKKLGVDFGIPRYLKPMGWVIPPNIPIPKKDGGF